MKRGYNRQDVANSLMAPTGIDRLLQYEGTIANRGGVLPFVRRVVPDIGGDDISEFEGPLELGLPALLYDPLSSMAKVGAMATGDMKINPDIITNAAVDAPLMGSLLSGATGAVPRGAVLGANVFHGGPHRFAPEPDFPHGRPRLDKVGTGEGAQAYGYGFYSADAPGVANVYRDALRPMTSVEDLSVGGIPIYKKGVPVNYSPTQFTNTPKIGDYVRAKVQEDLLINERKLADAFDKQGVDGVRQFAKEIILEELDDALDNWPESVPHLKRIIKNIDDEAQNSVVFKKGESHLYKLDIPDADVAKYLDYDKPLSEQPKEIRDKFARAMLGERVFDDPILKDLFADGVPNEYMGLFEKSSGAQAYRTLAGKLGSEQAASEALRKIGIPGLKYFDQDSRAGGEGTRNYVTWDQDVLDRSKMLERDGVTLGANKGPTAALPSLLSQQDWMNSADQVTQDTRNLLSEMLQNKARIDRERQFYESGGI